MSDQPAVTAWPPPLPPNTRTNATAMLDLHAQDHNQIVDALTALLATATPQLALTEVVTTQSAIQTTAVDLTGLTITFTLATQRRVRLEGSVYFVKAAPDTSAAVYLQITDNTNTQKQGGASWHGAPGHMRLTIARILVLAPGTYTFKLRGFTGAGFVNTNSNGAEPSYVQAIDLGPA